MLALLMLSIRISAQVTMLPIDLSNMPDRLPDMKAGQRIELDISSITAEGGLQSVRWDLNPRLASRKYELGLSGKRKQDRDWRNWYFKAPALEHDKLLTFDFVAIANTKNKKGQHHRASKKIEVFVKAGTGKVKASIQSQTSAAVGDNLSLDAIASISENGKIAEYIWTQTEGPLQSFDIHSPVLHLKMPSFENENIGVFANDLQAGLPVSSPTNVIIPNGIKNHFNFKYKGAFRVDASAGEVGNISFSPSIIAVNPENTSIFISGTRSTVAEMKIPKQFGFSHDTSKLPVARIQQDFFQIKDKVTQGKLEKYTMNGMLVYQDSLIVTCEHSYDTKGRPWNIQFASDAYDLVNSDYKGFLQLEGRSRAAGFMSEIPRKLQNEFGGSFMAGWASNHSIDNRYSIGPSLYAFDPQDIVDANIDINPVIPTHMHLSYSLAHMISGGANEKSTEPNDPIWGLLASAHFGFIVPNTRKYIVFGRHAGLEGGVGYKISQVDGGAENGGERNYIPGDSYPYFWIFDIDEILNANAEYEPQPISYGKFMVPYLIDEQSYIKGGSWNSLTNTLYLSISNAMQGKKVKAPVILAFEVAPKSPQSESPSIPKRLGFSLRVKDEMGYSDATSINIKLRKRE
jgi:hypothetical protein